jgi:hypothetical protein
MNMRLKEFPKLKSVACLSLEENQATPENDENCLFV